MHTHKHTVAVLGAGAWGTALACALAQAGRAVTLVPRRAQQALELQQMRENKPYLPEVPLPQGVLISTELGAALSQAQGVLIGSPAKGLAQWCDRIEAVGGFQEDCWVVSLCKGLEPQTQLRPGLFWQKRFPGQPYAVLSGPNNAREVAQGQPAAAVLASEASGVEAIQSLLHTQSFRVYRSEDVAGVEWGACLKNVYAIAMGISDGLGFGYNARAALLTRAMTELVRLGKALGGREATFYGLSGLGDLTATAFGPWSRNRSFGEALGAGKPAAELLKGAQAVEGYASVSAFEHLARKKKLQAPILREVFRVLYEGAAPKACAEALLLRDLKAEAGV